MKRAALTVFVLLLALTGIFCLAACNDTERNAVKSVPGADSPVKSPQALPYGR